MDNTSLHAELKQLKANLLRFDFVEYFESENFRLTTLEKDYDDLFKAALKYYRRYSNERKLDAFIHVLNFLLLKWMDATPNSKQIQIYHTEFMDWLTTFVIDYFEWKKNTINSNKLIESIGKIGIVSKDDIKVIEEKLKNVIVDEAEKVIESNAEKQLSVPCFEIEYGIITALEEDEMEKALPLFEQEFEVNDTNNYIVFGHLKSNIDKKIVYASQHSTGVVDAAVLATEIITKFKPKYLIMLGVLGGKPEETQIGDVVIATKVYEIDRGKLSDVGFKKEISSSSLISKELKKIHRYKKDIERFIDSQDATRNTNVKLHFGPIATVNQVIDVDGFFENTISTIDRKSIALEMESFAVVRSCQLANEGKTIPIIIKSVMDNTTEKDDKNKTYAAWTSSKTLEYLLSQEIL